MAAGEGLIKDYASGGQGGKNGQDRDTSQDDSKLKVFAETVTGGEWTQAVTGSLSQSQRGSGENAASIFTNIY